MKEETWLYTYEVYTIGKGLRIKSLVSLEEMESDKENALMFCMISITRVQSSN